MENLPEELVKQVVPILTNSINNLLQNRNRNGNWGDVRSTALAQWALNEIFLNQTYNHPILELFQNDIKNTNKWIWDQAKPEDIDGYSWESEAWDTALSIISLSFDESYRDKIGLTTLWLRTIIDHKTGVWYDEVWESTLSTIALLRSERIRRGPIQYENWAWIIKVLQWLNSIPSKDDGEFVCPHYSGFLVWLLGEIQGSRAFKQISETDVYKAFYLKAESAKKWLFNWINYDIENLWSSYTFSNSYIIIGLSSLKQPLEIDYLNKFILWYQAQQGEHGGFEDIEDTSLAILALSFIMGDLKVDHQMIISEISKNTTFNEIVIKKCFFGYSGQAEQVAKEIIAHLKNTVTTMRLIDWKEDFRKGYVLIDEIQRACEMSDAAIFLFTKDDELSEFLNPTHSHMPRDNVVFEFGFYAAKIGMNKTLLIVEEGTKIPIDLSGILYVSMKSRTKLDDVKKATEKALKEILKK